MYSVVPTERLLILTKHLKKNSKAFSTSRENRVDVEMKIGRLKTAVILSNNKDGSDIKLH